MEKINKGKTRFLNQHLSKLFLILIALAKTNLQKKNSSYYSFKKLCSKYIANFPDYKCFKEKYMYYSKNKVIFKLIKQSQIYTLKIQKNNEKNSNELDILSQVSHCPNVAPLQDFLFTQELIFMIIPLYDFESLGQIVNDEKQILTFEIISKIFRKVMGALICINKFGILHRAIHSKNILINKNYEPHLINFNHSTFEGDTFVPDFVSEFSSPEMVMHYNQSKIYHFTSKDDVYSMGVLLYFMYERIVPIESSLLKYNLMVSKEIVFYSGDLMSILETIQKSLIVFSLRLNLNDFHIWVVENLTKSSLNTLDSHSFYRLNNPKMISFQSNYLCLLILIIVISLIFIIGISISLCMFCKCLYYKMSRGLSRKKRRQGQEYLYEEIN